LPACAHARRPFSRPCLHTPIGAGLTSAFGVTSDNFDNLFALTAVCVVSTLLPMPFLSLLPASLDRDLPGEKKDEGPLEEEMALLDSMEQQQAESRGGTAARSGSGRQHGGGGGGGGSSNGGDS
jgi:uncharacterized membrane protein YgcG